MHINPDFGAYVEANFDEAGDCLGCHSYGHPMESCPNAPVEDDELASGDFDEAREEDYYMLIGALDATVINVRTQSHVSHVYIGRGSRWGNPYRIGTHGDREKVIALYKRDLWNSLQSQKADGDTELLHALAALHGERLGCYCAPLPCHGDVLVAAARWARTQLA